MTNNNYTLNYSFGTLIYRLQYGSKLMFISTENIESVLRLAI